MAQAAILANGTKSSASDSILVSPAASTPSVGTKRKRTTEQKFYGVREGKKPGIYNTWEECLNQVTGHKGASFKAFPTLREAQAFVRGEFISQTKQAGEPKFYGVQVGKTPGVYLDWTSAQQQIQGIKGPKYRKFNTRAEAEAFVAQVRTRNSSLTEAQLPQEKKLNLDMISRSAPGLIIGSTYAAKDVNGNIVEPGTGPLPPGAEDGFDPNITLNTAGQVVHKSDAEKEETKIISKERDPLGMLTIYTDGSSLRNGQAGARAGVGVFFGPGDPRNVSEALKGTRQTNQRAELTAIVRALDIAPLNRDVRIYTDSRYSIDCVTSWYKNWVRNKWMTVKNKPVENKDLIMDIRQKIQEREHLKSRTYFVWVKGHANDEGNTAADRLAVDGATTGKGIDGEVEAVEDFEKAVIAEESMVIGNGDPELDDAFRAMESAMNE